MNIRKKVRNIIRTWKNSQRSPPPPQKKTKRSSTRRILDVYSEKREYLVYLKNSSKSKEWFELGGIFGVHPEEKLNSKNNSNLQEFSASWYIEQNKSVNWTIREMLSMSCENNNLHKRTLKKIPTMYHEVQIFTSIRFETLFLSALRCSLKTRISILYTCILNFLFGDRERY